MPHPGTIRLLSSVPVFLVDDANATAAWYRDHLGFETAGIFPPRGVAAWASLQRDGAEIMLQRLKGYRKASVYERRDGGVWNAYIRLTGVAKFYETVKGRPFVRKPLEREPYGDWDFEIVDLNGHVFSVRRRREHQRTALTPRQTTKPSSTMAPMSHEHSWPAR